MLLNFKSLLRAMNSSVAEEGKNNSQFSNIELETFWFNGEQYARIVSTNGRSATQQVVKIDHDNRPLIGSIQSAMPKNNDSVPVTIEGEEIVNLIKWLEAVEKSLKNKGISVDPNVYNDNNCIGIRVDQAKRKLEFYSEAVSTTISVPLSYKAEFVLSTQTGYKNCFYKIIDLKAGILAVAKMPGKGRQKYQVPSIHFDISFDSRDPLVIKSCEYDSLEYQTFSLVAKSYI